MNEEVITISIPTDNEGFVLLRCSLCGEFFKLRPSDYEDESVLDIWCPSCGLQADNYLSEEVIELALTKAQNIVMESLHDEMKTLERKTKGEAVQFKAGRPPKRIKEDTLMYSIDSLSEVSYPCCKKEAKVSRLYTIIGSYCPYCGIRNG